MRISPEQYSHHRADTDTDELTDNGKRRDREWGEPGRQIVPIEGRPWVQSNTVIEPSDIVQSHVVRSDPREPVEHRKRLEDESREEEPSKSG